MVFSTIIRNMMTQHKEASAKSYTLDELLHPEFIDKFTKFGSLAQFLEHTKLSADLVIKPGDVRDAKVNKYVRRNSYFRSLDHLLTVAEDYLVRSEMVKGMFK